MSQVNNDLPSAGQLVAAWVAWSGCDRQKGPPDPVLAHQLASAYMIWKNDSPVFRRDLLSDAPEVTLASSLTRVPYSSTAIAVSSIGLKLP